MNKVGIPARNSLHISPEITFQILTNTLYGLETLPGCSKNQVTYRLFRTCCKIGQPLRSAIDCHPLRIIIPGYTNIFIVTGVVIK